MNKEMVKFRCSMVGILMTDPKLKADKEAGNLSEGAKTYIESVFLENNYGYKDFFQTDETLKGILTESTSLKLVHDVLGGEFRFKNRDLFENDYIKGTPDVILSEIIEDIKSSFTIKTFLGSDITKQYEWQLRAYMWLTGRKKARLIYCLNDTPSEILTKLKHRESYKYSETDFLDVCNQIDKNHTYSHIPAKDRVKVFEIEHSDEKIELLKAKIIKAREYYSQLKLV